jgi:hypothetical protein
MLVASGVGEEAGFYDSTSTAMDTPGPDFLGHLLLRIKKKNSQLFLFLLLFFFSFALKQN